MDQPILVDQSIGTPASRKKLSGIDLEDFPASLSQDEIDWLSLLPFIDCLEASL